ncbi:MAG: hypothetical protein L3J39_14605 [Verrucomicrobiales bacterium]|nr:hypothetical protein [Verrucomicrobiales bacterium]
MPLPDLPAPLLKLFAFIRKQNPFTLAILVLMGMLSIYLIFADKPWDPTLDFSASVSSKLRVHSYVVSGLWWGALINLSILSACLFGSLFYPPAPSSTPSGIDQSTNSWKSLPLIQRRTILVLSLLAVALSAMLNAPLLNHSLWGDEEATARRFIVGHINRQSDQTLRLHTPSWEKTLWNFENGPNNHVLYSILGRVSHSFAKPANGPDDLYFSEFWLRLPTYLSGLCAVATIAWLMVVLGFPRTAPLAATLLALHPWFVRWGTEARGYSLVLFLIPLILVFLLKALQSKKESQAWGWWLAYGFTEFLLIYAHLGSVYFLFPLNIAALLLAWQQARLEHKSLNPLHHRRVWQYTTANLLGTILTIQLLAPCIKPLGTWLAKSRTKGDITWHWIEDWFSYFASGMPWSPWNESNPYCITLPDALEQSALLTSSALTLIAISLLIGFFSLLLNQHHRYLLLPLLAPGLLTVLHAKVGGNLLYPWYMVGFLPLCIIVVSVGLERISAIIPKAKNSAWVIVALLFCGLFAILTHEQRQLYRNHPVEALARSVRETREVINPFDPKIDEVITLDVCHATRLYDPAHLRIRNLAEFVAALKLADSTERPLFINMANTGLLTIYLPQIGQMIDNRELFQEPIVIHGLQNPCTRYIVQYIPHSLDKTTISPSQ